MPNCSSCGLSLSQGATICPACGSWGAGGAAPPADVAEALIVAAVAVAGGSLAVWLPTLLGLRLSLLCAR
jgi:hypothetical protein